MSQRHRRISTEVTDRGEPRTHGDSAETDSINGGIGQGSDHGSGERSRAELATQVCVRIDEAGEQRHVSEVQLTGTIRNVSRVHRQDAAVHDEHCDVLVHLPGFDIEHALSTQEGGLVLGMEREARNQRNAHCREHVFHDLHSIIPF